MEKNEMESSMICIPRCNKDNNFVTCVKERCYAYVPAFKIYKPEGEENLEDHFDIDSTTERCKLVEYQSRFNLFGRMLK